MMVTYKEAYELIMEHVSNFGHETVKLNESNGRVLAEDIIADRAFPPYDRATKDGIAFSFETFERGRRGFEIETIQAAGMPKIKLNDKNSCIEIMTGAVIPYNTDTVVMYEQLDIAHGVAELKNNPVKGQNIHKKGSDEKKGAVVLKKNTRISAAEIGVLAAVGKANVLVKKLPSTSVISTGNELVKVEENPKPHQIRRSNAYSLSAALAKEGINPLVLHLADDKDMIRQKLSFAIQELDVLLLSGGVSKGKYDFIPEVLSDLGVEQIFHGVLQRPGKPFWFGRKKNSKTIIFSFPGNPASTFANYHIYFKDWLRMCLGLTVPSYEVVLVETIDNKTDLTRFLRAKCHWKGSHLMASLVIGNGSGDLTSLSRSDGFIRLDPQDDSYMAGSVVPFIPTRELIL